MMTAESPERTHKTRCNPGLHNVTLPLHIKCSLYLPHAIWYLPTFRLTPQSRLEHCPNGLPYAFNTAYLTDDDRYSITHPIQDIMPLDHASGPRTRRDRCGCRGSLRFFFYAIKHTQPLLSCFAECSQVVMGILLRLEGWFHA